MDYEMNDIYSPDDSEMIQDGATEEKLEEVPETQTEASDIHKSINPGVAAVIGYEAYKISEMPKVKETISEIKENFAEKISDAKEAVSDFCTKLGEEIKDYTMGIYDSVKEFFTGSKDADQKEFSMYSKEFTETREFGIEHCVDAAKEYFNEGVIAEWSTLTDYDRANICYAYADEVAKAFELDNYKGIIFEQLEPGVNGYNSGDGYAHISTDLLNPLQTPMQLIDTITHELRHQYQSECVNGSHDVADEVRNEWGVAQAIYTDGPAWCDDPWGYMYNPLEIDSRYAAETVVREVTSKMFNDVVNALA